MLATSTARVRLGGPPRRAPRARGRARTRRALVLTRAAASGGGGGDDVDENGGERRPSTASSTSALSLLCPLLKVFSGGDAAAPRNRALEVTTSGLASMSRMPHGVTVDAECAERAPSSHHPSRRIVLYEFEACPFCRRVREALTQLDLSVEVRPCPKDARVHRAEVEALGGKQSFPFLVDPNGDGGDGVAMYESEDIVRYLYANYGNGAAVPETILSTTALTGWMPTLLRAGRGMTRYATAPEFGRAEDDDDGGGGGGGGRRPLTLYNYEGNQFARLAREALCELEIPYVLANAGKGSPRRAELTALDPGASVPYLIDPNTGTKLGESEEIVGYLFRTYGGEGAVAVAAGGAE